MIRQFAAIFLLVAGFTVIALAADAPSDVGAFTAYVQNKLQLYSPSPIDVAGPLNLSVRKSGTEIALPSLKPLYELCPSSTEKYDEAVSD